MGMFSVGRKELVGDCFGPVSAPGEERRPGLVDQHSVRSAISSASSTSIPRYLTVLSNLR